MDNLQQNKQDKQKISLTADELQRSTELMTLQTWDGLAPGETKQAHLAGIVAFQTKHDQAVVARMQASGKLKPVRATVPVAQPPVPAPAADETRKQRRERAKLEKKTAETLRDRLQAQGEALTPEIQEDARKKGYDVRSIQVFCDNYQHRASGKPANDEAAETLKKNQKFVNDYVYGTQAEHEACLQDMTDKLLSYKLDMHLFDDPEEAFRHLTEYRDIGDRLTYFDAVMKDNKPWFDALPDETRARIEDKMALYVPFSAAADAVAAIHNIEFNHNLYIGDNPDMQKMADLYAEQLPTLRDNFKSAWMASSIQAEARGFAEQTKQDYSRQDALFRQQLGVGFSQGATQYQYEDIAKYRELIAGSPEAYAANRQTIDAVFSDLYRVYDRLGSLNLEIKSIQAVSDAHNAGIVSGTDDDLIAQQSGHQVAALLDEHTAYSHYAGGLMDALKYMLGGGQLSQSVTEILARYGVHPDDNQQPDKAQS